MRLKFTRFGTYAPLQWFVLKWVLVRNRQGVCVGYRWQYATTRIGSESLLHALGELTD